MAIGSFGFGPGGLARQATSPSQQLQRGRMQRQEFDQPLRQQAQAAGVRDYIHGLGWGREFAEKQQQDWADAMRGLTGAFGSAFGGGAGGGGGGQPQMSGVYAEAQRRAQQAGEQAQNRARALSGSVDASVRAGSEAQVPMQQYAQQMAPDIWWRQQQLANQRLGMFGDMYGQMMGMMPGMGGGGVGVGTAL